MDAVSDIVTTAGAAVCIAVVATVFFRNLREGFWAAVKKSTKMMIDLMP
jgi:hypothetical protein